MNKDCTCPQPEEEPKVKRFCKGCYADVTDTMYCHCGDQPLTIGSTWTEDEISEPNDEIRE